MYSKCKDITRFFPFIFSGLVYKLNCADLEGYGDLPEDLRPQRVQKPLTVTNTTENSEDIRILYSELISMVISRDFTEDSVRLFIKDIVDIVRTLQMDPAADVSLAACELASQTANRFTHLLTYFSPLLGRASFNALTHRQSRLRIAALKTLRSLFICSPFKKNVEIMEDLIGFSDPNMVPIKDFYEPSSKINYFARLIADSVQSVREEALSFFAFLLIEAEDRFDHEARVVPYLLSGLFDQNELLASKAFVLFEKVGEQYEKDNEKDLREVKQYGVDSVWTSICRAEDYYWPVETRPRLGARMLVKKYVKRYIKGLCKDLDCLSEDTRERTVKLLLFSVVYAEENIIEFLVFS